jgi:hypothetical protein
MLFKFLGCLSRADLTQSIKCKIIWPNWRGSWILGRHACLGRDVFDLVDCDLPIFNIQKGRVDYLVSSILHKFKRARTFRVSPFLSRADIIPLLRQQEFCGNLPKHPPEFIYMDSFSELADQFFVHRKDLWGWCCCYSDINHTEEFKVAFRGRGLLNIDSIESNYRLFFNFIRKKYGEVPILFLHFPSTFESRLKYVKRAEVIYLAIEKMTKEYSRLYSISVDKNIVSRPTGVQIELEGFPYHYNDEVYRSLADKVSSILNKILS